MSLRYLYRFLLFIACCFSAQRSFSQPIENHFTHYTAKDGLAEGAISCITQDTTGFLWIGTRNGLCRFDGHTFKTYRYIPTDTNTLRENIIYGLFLDSKKHLWIMTPHWLYLYHPDGEWFEHFQAPDAFLHNCFEDNDSQLIITARTTQFRFDMRKKKFSPFYHGEMATGQAFEYKKDEDGIEWFATERGLVRYDPKTKKNLIIDSTHSWQNKKENNSVIKIILLPDGYLLASFYEDGLLLVNRKTCTYKEFHTNQINPEAPLPKVNPIAPSYKRTDCIYKLNDSIILCSASGGLSVFNWRRSAFTYFKPEKSDPASLLESDICISSIFCDREGIIWLGGDYLEKYDYTDYNIKMFPEYGKEQNPKQFASFYDLYRCADGTFLMGEYIGMSAYNTLTGKLINNNDKISYNGRSPLGKINYFNEGAGGNIWCYAHRSVRVFSLKNNRAENIKQYKLPDNITGIYTVKMDRKGRILVATDGMGMAVFDTSAKAFTFFNARSKAPSQLTSSASTAICEDHNGCIWVGTQRGLNKIEQDGITVKQYSQNKKKSALLPDWWVSDIAEDKHGIIWFTTFEHGIGRVDPRNDSVSFFSVAQGLPTCLFDQLCIDEQDNLWAVSKMGIVNLNVVTLQNKLCTEDQGFPIPDDINTIHYSKFTKKLYILTPYSLFEVNAKDTGHNYNIPPTTITEFSVFDKDLPFSATKNISLNYNENFISIGFAALLFHSNKQIKYAYKMDGVDADWVYCNYNRQASYTNLSPGHYTFSVKAQSPGGIWNEPTVLSIIIKPPFWQTWWFYLAELLCVIAFLIWLTRLYTARKLAKQKNEIEKSLAVSNERTRIASDMHDDLGAGLTSIRLLSEIANQKTDKESAAKTEIEKIALAAGNLSENLREIIWTINTRNDILEDFIIYIRTYAVEYFDSTQIKFEFYRPDSIPYIPMEGELRRNMFLCIKEALHNIVKHSQATEASLTFEITGNYLVTTIADNGIGINLALVRKSGNGLNIMRERLKKFGSVLEIESSNGTKQTFKMAIIL